MKLIERLPKLIWLLFCLILIVVFLSVSLFPNKILYSVLLDRQIKFFPTLYISAARVFSAFIVIGIATTTIFYSVIWEHVRAFVNKHNRNYFAEYYELLAGDFRAWKKSEQFLQHFVGLILLIIVGVYLRYYPLMLPIGYDESISFVWFSSRNWLDVITIYKIPNNHIFYNLLVNLLTKAFGDFEVMIRLPALLSGIMLIPVSYWLVYLLFNKEAAFLTAGLSACSPLVVEYSTQGRGYTLLWLIFLLCFVNATYLKEKSNIVGWSVFVILAALGFFTIPVMFIGIVYIGLWMLISAPADRKKRLLGELTMAGIGTTVLTLLLYLPAYLRSGIKRPLNETPELFRMLSSWIADMPWLFAGLIILGIILALASFRSDREAHYMLIATVLTLIVAAVFHAPARVTNLLFFMFAGIASYGLSVLFSKITFSDKRFATYLWVIVVITAVSSWGLIRLNNTRIVEDSFGTEWVNGAEPGADGIACCAEGYFVDAEISVYKLLPELRTGDAIITLKYTGMVETMRFYLMKNGRSPVLVHQYDQEKGLDQLEVYDRMFVVIKTKPPNPASEVSNSKEVYKMLGVESIEFEKEFLPPKFVAANRISKIYSIVRRVPLNRDPSKPIEIPFNMFWFW